MEGFGQDYQGKGFEQVSRSTRDGAYAAFGLIAICAILVFSKIILYIF